MKTISFNKNSSATIKQFNSIKECAHTTVKHISSGNIALSGGATYRQMCIAWSRESIHFQSPLFYPVDERVVPFADPQSNWGMIYSTFLQPLGFEKQKAHFAESARQFEQLLLNKFNNKFSIFDAIFLGVGDDGHTASLFPGNSFLHEQDSMVLSTKSPKPPINRISLAPITIINAKKVIVVIHGDNKRCIVREILSNNQDLPIVRILSARTKSLIFIHKNLL